MSLYIDSASRLHHDLDKNLVVTCPHCQAVAHITASAVPRFEDLQLYRPKQVGLVYLCDACHAPIFLRAVGPMSNLTPFYEAFGVRPGDRMYRADTVRVRIW